MADKTARVEFDEYPDKAFVIRLSPIALDDYMDLNERLGNLKGMDSISAMVDRFAEVAFVGWEGFDEEPTPANLRKCDFNLLIALVGQWSKAVAEAPLPLPLRSASGGPSKVRKASRSRKS